MNVKLSTNRKFHRILVNILSIFAILAIALPVTSVAYAVPSSPFVGHWQATDIDGSDIRLTVAGRPNGPFQITWTESYISFCNREAGIVRGTGWLNEGDPDLLEADLHLECFTTGASLDFHLVWRYHPLTDTLSSRYDNGVVTIWHRPGRPLPLPPALGLRVNYGHDWVESFYEAGHMAWITVTESDGMTVKATAELVTEPKDYWGGESGFQSLDSVWFDAEGNPMESPPDIQPDDWVFGWVDNSASAQVQIGDISGMIDLTADSIEGTILAPWITDLVQVECLDWGSGGEPFGNKDGGLVLTNGDDPYSCSWAGEWDIQPEQTVGVGYFDPDGNWVSNAFIAPNPRIVASEAGDWFWTTDFYPGTLDLFIYQSQYEGEGVNQLWSGQQEADQWGFTLVGYDVHGQDLVSGNYLVISDGVNEKGLVLETITMEVFDTENEIMAGTAPLGSEVWVAAGPQDWQEHILVQADLESGAWLADFKTIGFDITEDMRGWSFAQIFDEDGDANEAGTPPPPPTPVMFAFPADDVVEGFGWEVGDSITLSIGDFVTEATVGLAPWDPSQTYVRFDLREQGYDLQAGDLVVMSDGHITKELTVSLLELTDFNLGADTISGIYDPTLSLWVNVEGHDAQITQDGDTWIATFADFDLGPLNWGTAIQTDADRDETRAGFRTPGPGMYAVPDEERIYASEWTPGENLVVSINGAEVASQVIPDNGSLYGPEVLFDLNGVFDLQAGDTITMTDGRYSKELIVHRLQVTGFDLGTHTVFGVADPGPLFIGVNGEDMWITVGDDGTWQASSPGFEPLEWGSVIKTDEDGDQTRDIFMIPRPMMYAFPEDNVVAGVVWTEGELLTLKVYDSVTGEIAYERTEIVPPPSEVPWTAVHFYLGNAGYDLKTGDRLVMGQGSYERELIVSSLQITGFDLGSHIISGIGDPGADFLIRIDGQDVWAMVGDDGTWSIYHELLQSGAWGEAIQPDADGDETRDGFQAPFE